MKTIGLPLLTLGLVLAIAPFGASQDAGANNFTLATHSQGGDFWFTLEGQDAKNPTLNVQPGATVTMVVKNTDGGFHNLHVKSPVDQKTPDVSEEGAEETLTFTAPESGTLEYVCDYHLTTMKGTITVGTASAGATQTEEKESPGVGLLAAALALVGGALLLRRK